jgi:hypothetical protein
MLGNEKAPYWTDLGAEGIERLCYTAQTAACLLQLAQCIWGIKLKKKVEEKRINISVL